MPGTGGRVGTQGADHGILAEDGFLHRSGIHGVTLEHGQVCMLKVKGSRITHEGGHLVACLQCLFHHLPPHPA